MKKASQEGALTLDVARAIMSEEKKAAEVDKVTFTTDKLRKYFPKSVFAFISQDEDRFHLPRRGRASVREKLQKAPDAPKPPKPGKKKEMEL